MHNHLSSPRNTRDAYELFVRVEAVLYIESNTVKQRTAMEMHDAIKAAPSVMKGMDVIKTAATCYEIRHP